MALKDKFLSYVEKHKCANETRLVKGPDHPKTVDAYQELNQLKREVLMMIETLEK